MLTRPERPEDRPDVRRVHESAFPTPAEAALVDILRERGKATVSLVAELDELIVGHVGFSPVTIDAAPNARGLGLGPVAVLPDHQRRGIGSRLIREGIEACRRAGCPFVVILGEPGYYKRSGFERGSAYSLSNEYGADEAFMVSPLRPGGIAVGGGRVRYAPEFAEAFRR